MFPAQTPPMPGPAASNSLFGGQGGAGSSASATTSTSHAFGSPFGVSSGNVFGAGSNIGATFGAVSGAFTNGLFGATAAGNVFGSAVSGSSSNVFGASSTTAANVFGGASDARTDLFAPSSVAPTSSWSLTSLAGGTTAEGGTQFGAVFGTSAPVTSAFGAPVYAAVPLVKPFGSISASNLFGSTTSEGFSQVSASQSENSAIQPKSGSEHRLIFGMPSTTIGTLGTSTSVFGAQTTGSGVFGASNSSSSNVLRSSATGGDTNVFGTMAAGSRNVFGVPASSGSNVFGATSSFGSNVFGPPVASSSIVFGAPSTSRTAVFGAQIETFGVSNSSGVPLTSGSTSVGLTKSLNVFGATAGSSGVFGAQSSKPNPFGATATESRVFGSSERTIIAPATSTTSSNVFGAPSTSSSSSNIFGASSATSSGSNVFGAPSTSSGSNVFGAPSTSSGSNVFGAPSTSSGSNVFGGPRTSTASNIFGAPSSATGSTVFGAPSTSTGLSVFGASSTFGNLEAAGVSRVFSAPVIAGSSGQEEGGVKGDVRGNEERDAAGGGVAGRLNVEGGLANDDARLRSRVIIRRRPLEDASSTANLVAIVAKNVPDAFIDMGRVQQHFGNFGKVGRVFLNPTARSVTVHFADHESASNAKRNGTIVSDSEPPLEIFWRNTEGAKNPRNPAVVGANARPTNPSPTKRTPISRDPPPPTYPDPKLAHRPIRGELDDELSSMQGTEDVSWDVSPSRLRGTEAARPKTSHAVARLYSGLRPEGERRAVKLTGGRNTAGEGGGPASEGVGGGRRMTAGRRGGSASPTPGRDEEDAGGVQAVSHSSLRSLAEVTANTAAERFALLEARDKLIKAALGGGKHADLATAQAVRGSCQDMCPEKERYMREERRRLSIFEMVPTGAGSDLPGRNAPVDHARAVKEYSRSSADQDMPLPSELRPPETLDRTMNYLLSNVADRGGPGQWEDWFDFLWNRTRAIRKDITQQHLCDATAVTLTEKCARLHVFCAEALCEESAPTFDQKINDENLTKCLQSLKELYHDLAVRRGIACPCEAEFRTYMLLMNLNEGASLREVQQLRDDVRESPEVRFGVSIYLALNGNNYIRFFRLVRSATFLEACILHRYFMQIRTRALQCVLRTYYLPGQVALYPLAELVRQLEFADEAEAGEFCAHHGLTVTSGGGAGGAGGGGGQLVLDRTQFITPEAAFPVRRSILLVESKLTTSIGELGSVQAINGGPLPPNIIREPTTSFDQHGCFTGAGWVPPRDTGGDGKLSIGGATSASNAQSEPIVAAAALEGGTGKLKEGGSVRLEESGSGRPEEDGNGRLEELRSQAAAASVVRESLNEAIREIARELFHEVIREICVAMSQSTVSAIGQFLSYSNPIGQELLDSTTNEMLRALCCESLAECKNEEHELIARHHAMVSAACEGVSIALLEETMATEIRDLTREFYSLSQEAAYRDRVDRATDHIAEDLILEVIYSDAPVVGAQVYEQDVVQRLCTLARCEAAVHRLRAQQCWSAWRNSYLARQRLKRSMESFPSAPSMNPWPHQYAYLLPDSTRLIHFDAPASFLSPLARLPPQGGEILPGDGFSLDVGRSTMVTLKSPDVVKRDQARLMAELSGECAALRGRMDEARRPLGLAGLVREAIPVGSRGNSGCIARTLANQLDSPVSCDWLKLKFRNGTVPKIKKGSQIEMLSLFTAPLLDNLDEPPFSTKSSLGVCVLAVTGDFLPPLSGSVSPRAGSDRRHLMGASALIFVTGHGGFDTIEGQRLERQRLHSLLAARPPIPPLPLAVLVPGGQVPDSVDVISVLELNSLTQDRVIARYRVELLDIDLSDASKQLTGIVDWLCTNCPDLPLIESQPIRDFLEDGLDFHFYRPLMNKIGLWNRNSIPHASPDVLIRVYNDTVMWLAGVVTHERLRDLSWPAIEFCVAEPNNSDSLRRLPRADWNEPNQLSWLRQTLHSATLPLLGLADRGGSEADWPTACEDVWTYVREVAEECSRSNSQFFSRMQLLLARVEAEFARRSNSALRLVKGKPRPLPRGRDLPWSDVIVACIEHKLSHLYDLDPQAGDDELMVHYLVDSTLVDPSTVMRQLGEHEELTALSASMQVDASDSQQQQLQQLQQLLDTQQQQQVRGSSKRKFPPGRSQHPDASKLHRPAPLSSTTPLIPPSGSIDDDPTFLRAVTLLDTSRNSAALPASGNDRPVLPLAEDRRQSDPSDMTSADRLRKLILEERVESAAFEELLRRKLDGENIPPSELSLSVLPVPPTTSAEPEEFSDLKTELGFPAGSEKGGGLTRRDGEGKEEGQRWGWTFGGRVKSLNDSLVEEMNCSRLCELQLQAYLDN